MSSQPHAQSGHRASTDTPTNHRSNDRHDDRQSCLSCGLRADALIHHAAVNGHPFTGALEELAARAAAR